MQNAAYCTPPAWSGHRGLTKIWLIVKLSIVLLTTALIHVQAAGLSQSITLSGKNLDVKQVFAAIKKQTGYVVFYKKGLLAEARPVSLSVQNMPLTDFLELSLKDQPFTWLILDKTISLSRKPAPAVGPVQPAESRPQPPADPPTSITGRIFDADGNPLAGASITIKNSKTSTSSHADGTFILFAHEGDVLTISFIGYVTRQVKLSGEYFGTGKKSLVIRLQLGNSDLDQVQVLAHGLTTKRLNPGDVTTITATEIAKNPVGNVMEAIQGKVPGLFIQQVTGQPGGAFNLQVRSSTNVITQGSIQPLIIIDGVRFPQGTVPLNYGSDGTNAFLQGGNTLNYLNPADIASIDVLKDADATAIYGSSGAYGVIIITTKKAKASDPSLNVNIYSGISTKGEMPKLLNTQQYVMLREEAIKNDGLTPGASDADVNGKWPQNTSTDWRKVFMGSHAQSTSANITYSGGSRNTTYLIGGSLRQNGNIQLNKGNFTDGTLRFALSTATLDDKFHLDLSGSYLSSKDDMVPYDFSLSSVIEAPNAPSPLLPDGTVNWLLAAVDPNGASSAANFNRTYSNVTGNLLANAALVYKPVAGITLRTIFGYNDLAGKELIGKPTTVFAPTNTTAAQQTVGIFHNYDTRTITVSPYAEYDRTLWKGDLSVKAGGEIDDRNQYWYEMQGVGFPSDALLNDPAEGTTVTSTYNQVPFRPLGFYGIIKYVWDQKYILDLNGRRDGSTRFAPRNRFGNFGSIAAAWIFSEEKFVKDHLSFLSFGKLRGSTGVIGGDAIPDYGYLTVYGPISGTYDGKLGLDPTANANPNLKWELDHDKEIGLELGFFKDRVIMEGSYYHNESGNQLVNRPIASTTGSTAITLNSDAVIRNSGWEMSLSTTNVKTKNFTWSTRFNMTIPTSKLIKLPTMANQNTSYMVGKPLTGILLYNYAGVDPATGTFSYTNAKGVTKDFTYGSLTQTDKTQFVDLAPRYYGGFSNSFSYKQFTLDVYFTYISRKGYNSLAQSGFLFGSFDINSTTQWLRRWQKPGDRTDIPKVTSSLLNNYFGIMNFKASTGAYTDATYARLQNLSFRYKLSPGVLKKMHLRECTIYLQGQNLLTISKFGGLDPENLNATVIPPLRTYTAGINLTL
ncbi:SusC/RagA family TonB-linked outer membrane protein [Puia dinghuensis]|uniref:SusC/RagA family TonB-linked outer membrane protein n=1 Tax=Puia dinghuensis TaxID=1792502 RepID=A0A8J2UDJ0_9BACT|nr:SusC/RagA family TonB-linked outer membrane protein [Puia dinghuensis]GGB00915.1 SusC/RagA family TonB-linked outer membrane protein [Puia dinghuensis]